MKHLILIITFGLCISCSNNNNPTIEEKPPLLKKVYVQPSYIVDFDLKQVDSLIVFIRCNDNFKQKEAFNRDDLLRSSFLMQKPNSDARYLDLDDSLNINNEYKFVFFMSNKMLTYVIKDIDTEYFRARFEDGSRAYISKIFCSKINGIETEGSFVFDYAKAVKGTVNPPASSSIILK